MPTPSNCWRGWVWRESGPEQRLRNEDEKVLQSGKQKYSLRLIIARLAHCSAPHLHDFPVMYAEKILRLSTLFGVHFFLSLRPSPLGSCLTKEGLDNSRRMMEQLASHRMGVALACVSTPQCSVAARYLASAVSRSLQVEPHDGVGLHGKEGRVESLKCSCLWLCTEKVCSQLSTSFRRYLPAQQRSGRFRVYCYRLA